MSSGFCLTISVISMCSLLYTLSDIFVKNEGEKLGDLLIVNTIIIR